MNQLNLLCPHCGGSEFTLHKGIIESGEICVNCGRFLPLENIYLYDAFLICPVRNATEMQKGFIEGYLDGMSLQGKNIYYPARDTNQDDPTGLDICTANTKAISESKEVHVFWNKNSTGTLFDLGVAFALQKPIKIINIHQIEKTEGKSFSNMLIAWSEKCQLDKK